MVELIALAAEAEGPMKAVSAAEATEGRGLLGDRYERQAGTFSSPKGGGYDLTLVEAEALEELSAKGVGLPPIEARRNIVVRGIALDDLIGQTLQGRGGRVLRPAEVRAVFAPRTPDAAGSVTRPRTPRRAASRHTLGR